MQTVAWAAKGRGGGEQAEPNELHYITAQYVCVYACVHVCLCVSASWEVGQVVRLNHLGRFCGPDWRVAVFDLQLCWFNLRSCTLDNMIRNIARHTHTLTHILILPLSLSFSHTHLRNL